MGDGVVFFELPADDPSGLSDFYATTFGWGMTSIPGLSAVTQDATGGGTVERELIQAIPTPVDRSGLLVERNQVPGLVSRRVEDVRNPVIFINVSDLEEALQRVRRNGGTVVVGPTGAGDTGSYAYFRDIAGNVVGLWRDAVPGVRVGVQEP